MKKQKLISKQAEGLAALLPVGCVTASEILEADRAWQCPACLKTYPTYALAKCCREIPVRAREEAGK